MKLRNELNKHKPRLAFDEKVKDVSKKEAEEFFHKSGNKDMKLGGFGQFAIMTKPNQEKNGKIETFVVRAKHLVHVCENCGGDGVYEDEEDGNKSKACQTCDKDDDGNASGVVHFKSHYTPV